MKIAFNEGDRYLADHWAEACGFEQGMAALRKKHEAVLESALAELRERDWWESDFKSYVSENYGCIGFGRKSWDPTDHPANFPGLWLDDLELDHLLIEGERHPEGYLWIAPIKKAGQDLIVVRAEILKAAAPALNGFPPRTAEDDRDIVCYKFPEARKDIVRLLFQEGPKPFVDLVCQHADRLATLIPAVDAVLRRGSRK